MNIVLHWVNGPFRNQQIRVDFWIVGLIDMNSWWQKWVYKNWKINSIFLIIQPHFIVQKVKEYWTTELQKSQEDINEKIAMLKEFKCKET